MHGGGGGVARGRESIHMSPGVNEDAKTGCFSFQTLLAASSHSVNKNSIGEKPTVVTHT